MTGKRVATMALVHPLNCKGGKKRGGENKLVGGAGVTRQQKPAGTEARLASDFKPGSPIASNIQ